MIEGRVREGKGERGRERGEKWDKGRGKRNEQEGQRNERREGKRECIMSVIRFWVLFVLHVPFFVIPIFVRSIPFKFSKSSLVLYPASSKSS